MELRPSGAAGTDSAPGLTAVESLSTLHVTLQCTCCVLSCTSYCSSLSPCVMFSFLRSESSFLFLTESDMREGSMNMHQFKTISSFLIKILNE